MRYQSKGDNSAFFFHLNFWTTSELTSVRFLIHQTIPDLRKWEKGSWICLSHPRCMRSGSQAEFKNLNSFSFFEEEEATRTCCEKEEEGVGLKKGWGKIALFEKWWTCAWMEESKGEGKGKKTTWEWPLSSVWRPAERDKTMSASRKFGGFLEHCSWYRNLQR